MAASWHGSMLVAGLALISLLAGCTSAKPMPSTAAGSLGAEPSPTQGAAAVHGHEDCQIVDASYEANIDRETFHCVETTSDVRLNGEWEALIVTTETGGGLGYWTVDLVMTNPGGTWRGTASGTTSGMPNNPTNLGVIVWVGEGGYAGLTYHELFSGSNARADTAGWVEPT